MKLSRSAFVGSFCHVPYFDLVELFHAVLLHVERGDAFAAGGEQFVLEAGGHRSARRRHFRKRNRVLSELRILPQLELCRVRWWLGFFLNLLIEYTFWGRQNVDDGVLPGHVVEEVFDEREPGIRVVVVGDRRAQVPIPPALRQFAGCFKLFFKFRITLI